MSFTQSLSIPSNFHHPASNDCGGGLLAALADEVAHGLIACEVDGLLRYANRSARTELARGHALRLVDNVVNLTIGPQAALRTALNDASRRGRRRMLSLGTDADRLMALTMRLGHEQGNDGNCAASSTDLVLIMLGRRGTCSALGIEMLAMLHGLTLAECRVLRALLDGDVPHRIAISQGVAVSTVRTHVRSIRDKVGVRSVEGLFIRAAEMPPVASAALCCERNHPSANERRSPAAAIAALA